MAPDALVISPRAPGNPDGGRDLAGAPVRHFMRDADPAACCLGHKAIGQAFGGPWARAASRGTGRLALHHEVVVFRGRPQAFEADAYHSPSCWTRICPPISRCSARAEDGEAR